MSREYDEDHAEFKRKLWFNFTWKFDFSKIVKLLKNLFTHPEI